MKVKLVATSLLVASRDNERRIWGDKSAGTLCGDAGRSDQASDRHSVHPEYAKAIGRTAYIWGWPMVNMLNRRAAITRAPEPGRLNGVLPAAPRGRIAMLSGYIDPGQTFVTCPNQDVVYGLGFFSLDEEPVVIQVP